MYRERRQELCSRAKYITREMWLNFNNVCLQSDINTLQKAVRIMDLGQRFYGEISLGESICGLGVYPNKFRKARNIMEDVISLRLGSSGMGGWNEGAEQGSEN